MREQNPHTTISARRVNSNGVPDGIVAMRDRIERRSVDADCFSNATWKFGWVRVTDGGGEQVTRGSRTVIGKRVMNTHKGG
jgi:hypothetical protein